MEKKIERALERKIKKERKIGSEQLAGVQENAMFAKCQKRISALQWNCQIANKESAWNVCIFAQQIC